MSGEILRHKVSLGIRIQQSWFCRYRNNFDVRDLVICYLMVHSLLHPRPGRFERSCGFPCYIG